MKKFKDFEIKIPQKTFTGDKINVKRILNREIIVHDYKIVDSKYTDSGNGKCLHLSISINDVKYVVFTGSIGLMEEIVLVPTEGFPFSTTIVEDNDRFQFS
jgi:hypothetical protein